jgi:LysR family transcriptional activator of nhaA
MDTPVLLECREGRTERLLADLSIHGLDLVFSDEPLGSATKVRAYNHPLGESGLSFFGSKAQARKLRATFPKSLEGAPMLLPTEDTAVRRGLDRWFEAVDVRPKIVAEFQDSALLKVFGEHGAGIFAAPSVIQGDIQREYNVRVIGETHQVRESFYLISVERRIKHPAVAMITQRARETLFGKYRENR